MSRSYTSSPPSASVACSEPALAVATIQRYIILAIGSVVKKTINKTLEEEQPICFQLAHRRWLLPDQFHQNVLIGVFPYQQHYGLSWYRISAVLPTWFRGPGAMELRVPLLQKIIAITCQMVINIRYKNAAVGRGPGVNFPTGPPPPLWAALRFWNADLRTSFSRWPC
jgi:hypothetical protein